MLKRSVLWMYLFKYPLNGKLVNIIKEQAEDSKDKLKKINAIRLNNIKGTFWNNSATIFGLLITLISLFFSLYWAIYSIYPPDSWLITDFQKDIVKSGGYFIILILVWGTVVFIYPFVLRKIIVSLSPRQFAEASLANLDQKQILTYVAYKSWLLCHEFEKRVKIPDSFKQIVDSNGDTFDKALYEDNLDRMKKDARNLELQIRKFKADSYNNLNKCTELKNEAVRKLNLLPREFCHHILQFSTQMFKVRINNLKADVETIVFIINCKDYNEPNFVKTIEEKIKEVQRIHKDITKRRMRSLEQLIVFGKIHKYIIALASTTSTSEALKTFTRGLSEITSLSQEKNYKDKQEIVYYQVLSLLFRSKSHYGMDLMFALENFYNKNPFEERKGPHIPTVLHNLKYDENCCTQYFIENRTCLIDIRLDIVNKYTQAIEDLALCFNETLTNKINDEKKLAVEQKINNRYLCIFGYSRMVLNVLKANTKLLQDKNFKVFVMKENNTEMLDTRMFRYELNDEKPTLNIKESFTTSDAFFYSLLQPKDQVIMVAGAEAFIKNTNQLLHTNSYQKRVNKIITRLTNDEKKPTPDVWIVAGDYKVYNDFPEKESKFKEEFYSNHYDKVDLYDFADLAKVNRLMLITNNKDATWKSNSNFT